MPEGSNPTVEAVGLTLAYRDRIALADATFAFRAGTVTALVGPNGSGKSTLLGAIAGLNQPRSGTIRVLGDEPVRARRRIAYVLQSTEVDESLPITVREVVAMGCYARRGLLGRLKVEDHAAIDAAMDRLRIADLSRRHLRELSGGQRQRVYVAQGLVQGGEVLLLDEPVTGLDVVSRQTILEVVREERAAGRTVVLSTHDLGEAATADNVVLLAGRVVAAGAPGDVLTDEWLTAAYEGRLLRLAGGVVVVDEAQHHHHDHGDDHG
jgi:manganese transport system ATP-binding protein